jgi:hypothetical protein
MPVNFNATFTESGSFDANFTESNNLNANFDAKVGIGGVLPSDDLPLMDGEASAGTSRKFSRSDHRHPHDSEKMDYMSAITNLELEAMLQ